MNKDTLIKDLTNKKAWIPNTITALRLLGPIVIPKMALSKNVPGTILVASLLALTDFLDGKVARKLDAETELGATLDPIVDKAFAVGLLGQAVPERPIMALPLAMESVIALINTKSYLTGGEPKSNKAGKLKIWPLSAAILTHYLGVATGKPAFNNISNACIAGTVALEAVNIAEYYKDSKDSKDKETEYITVPQTPEEVCDEYTVTPEINEGRQYIKYQTKSDLK